MGKNDRMRMTRAATTLPAQAPRLLIALLLSAAGLSAFAPAFAQAPADPASAPVTAEPAASAPPAPAPRPKLHIAPAKPLAPTLLSAPDWAALTNDQRKLLAPLAADWNSLSPSQRAKWLNATPALATLPEPEMTRLHDRMRAWTQLTPTERLNARISFQVAKQVDANQREAKWEEYQALSPEKRKELADKAAARRKAQATMPAPAAKPLATGPKSNIVPAAPRLVVPVAVTGGLVQAKPGATTVLMTRKAHLPSHHMAGEAKVVADPSLVDPKTLLPKSLKAPVRAAAASAAPAASEPRP